LFDESADTLGGYIYSELGRVPVEGERLQVEDWSLTVEVVRSRRIIRIRCVRGTLPKETEEQVGPESENS